MSIAAAASPRRLFWKLFFAFWLTLLLAGGAVGIGVWLYNQSVAQGEVAEGPRASSMVHAAAVVLERGGRPALDALLQVWEERGGPRVYAVALDADGRGRELLGREVSAPQLAQAHLAVGGEHVREVPGSDGQRYLLFVPAALERHARPPPSPVLPVVTGLLASLIFAALLAAYLVRPIRHLRWAFGAVADGQLDTRVAPRMGRRRDEIADLGRDFDRMAQRLQSLVGAQHRLLHDVSHELRSPLARLQAAIGLLRQNPARLEAGLDRIEREAGRVDELVGELLTLSRLEAGTGQGPVEPADLMEMVATVADDAAFEAETLGRTVRFDAQGEVVAPVRAELLYRAFDNVIRNALKFTAEGSCVDVAAGVLDGEFRLVVEDRGPGVAADELESIFQPFHRGRNGSGQPGFGLGLAIARRAVQAHGGSLRAEAREGGGLRVILSLPLAPLS